MSSSQILCALVLSLAFQADATGTNGPVISAKVGGYAVVSAMDRRVTLGYHLETNLVGHTVGHTNPLASMEYLSKETGDWYYSWGGYRAAWATNCWLVGVRGMSATCVGYICTNGVGYVAPVTMVSPRHYLAATHLTTWVPFFLGSDPALFVDTNQVVFYRKSLAVTNVGADIAVGILDADLPESVGYVPVLPANYTNWIGGNMVVGIGRNQDSLVFATGLTFNGAVNWSGSTALAAGLGTDWTVCADPPAYCGLRESDSSSPARLLVGGQLVLVSHACTAAFGPDYARNAAVIEGAMHALSVSQGLASDYGLSVVSLTNWPVMR